MDCLALVNAQGTEFVRALNEFHRILIADGKVLVFSLFPLSDRSAALKMVEFAWSWEEHAMDCAPLEQPDQEHLFLHVFTKRTVDVVLDSAMQSMGSPDVNVATAAGTPGVPGPLVQPSTSKAHSDRVPAEA